MTVLRGAAWACALVAGGLVIGGCTPDEPEPRPTTPVETSTSAPETSEPTVAAPEMPAEAATRTPQGAIAYVQYWVELMNYAYRTGDPEPLEAASHPDCAECLTFVSDLNASLAGGNSVEGGVVTVSNLAGGEVTEAGTSIVSGSYAQEESRTVGPDGAVIEETAGVAASPGAFYTQWVDDRWLLSRVVALQ